MKTKMSVALLTLLIAAGCSENDQIKVRRGELFM